MTQEKKRIAILNELAKWNREFIAQATWKINRSIAPDSSDPLELVSDVLYTVIDKLDKDTHIDNYYKMVQEGMLSNYILKAIDTNCKSTRAPFLLNKLRRKRRITLDGPGLSFSVQIYPMEKTREEEKAEMEDFIKGLLSLPQAKTVFGEYWRYYVSLFLEYCNDRNCTYQKLADKYGIPLSSIKYDFLKIKSIIREQIKTRFPNEHYF